MYITLKYHCYIVVSMVADEYKYIKQKLKTVLHMHIILIMYLISQYNIICKLLTLEIRWSNL